MSYTQSTLRWDEKGNDPGRPWCFIILPPVGPLVLPWHTVLSLKADAFAECLKIPHLKEATGASRIAYFPNQIHKEIGFEKKGIRTVFSSQEFVVWYSWVGFSVSILRLLNPCAKFYTFVYVCGEKSLEYELLFWKIVTWILSKPLISKGKRGKEDDLIHRDGERLWVPCPQDSMYFQLVFVNKTTANAWNYINETHYFVY